MLGLVGARHHGFSLVAERVGVNVTSPTIHAIEPPAGLAPLAEAGWPKPWPRPADSVRPVDVRIGVTQAPRELNIELGSSDGDRRIGFGG